MPTLTNKTMNTRMRIRARTLIGTSRMRSRVQPTLNVANVAASLAYYRERLGFEVCWARSEADEFLKPAAPTRAELMRGKCMLNLAQQAQGRPGIWLFADVATRAGLEAVRLEYERSPVGRGRAGLGLTRQIDGPER